MNTKERTSAVLRGEEPDRIPLLIYDGLLPRGSTERYLRNKDLGLIVTIPVYSMESPNVSIEQKKAGDILHATYHTPVGSLSMKRKTGLKEGTGGSWVTEHLIKDISDYEVVKFIFEDIEYSPEYRKFQEAERDLGNDGIVRAMVDRSPLQKMIIELMGFSIFSIHSYRYPKELEKLYSVVEKKLDEQYRMTAESPAEVIIAYENVSGVMTSPKLFEKYCVKFYKKQAKLFHKKDKIYEIHLDGLLNCLKYLIKETDADVIEAFTPPPVGDLSLTEAKTLWGEHYIIALNFPGTTFLMGPNAVKTRTIEILKEAAPGNHFLITFTEDIPIDFRDAGLMTIANTILEYGSYPISIDE